MKPFTLFLFALVLCGQLSACSRPSSGYSEEDVRAFVRPGTSRQAILDRFGTPTSQDKSPSVKGAGTGMEESLCYMLPPPALPRDLKWAFAGFVVSLRDGKAVSWQPIHRDFHVGP